MPCPYEQQTTDALRLFRLENSYRGIVGYGIHAGFPVCCIYFYARIWSRWSGPTPDLYEASNQDPDEETRRRLWATHPHFMRTIDDMFEYIAEESGYDVGYVRCPWCVVNDHRVSVRAVDTSVCGCWSRPRAT